MDIAIKFYGAVYKVHLGSNVGYLWIESRNQSREMRRDRVLPKPYEGPTLWTSRATQVKEEKEEGQNKRRRSSKEAPPTCKERCTAMTCRGQCANPGKMFGGTHLTLFHLSMRPCQDCPKPLGRLTLTCSFSLVLCHHPKSPLKDQPTFNSSTNP